MDNDLDLSRYAASLRRNALWIGAVALLGLLVGVFAATRSDYIQTIRFQAVPKVAELSSVGLISTEFDFEAIVDLIVDDANQDPVEDRLAEQVGKSVDLTAFRDVERLAIRVVVKSSSAESTARAGELYTDRARAKYLDELSRDLIQLQAGITERRLTTLAQIEDTDAQLEAAGAGQQTLVEGLLVYRQELIDRLNRLDAQYAAIERFGTDTDQDLRATVFEDPSQTSPVKLGVLGLFGLGGLALALTLALSAIDQTLRTRRDLSNVGLTDLVAVIPRPPTDLALHSAQRAIDALASALDTQAVQIIPVSDRGNGAMLAPLQRLDPSCCEVTVRRPTTVGPEAVGHASRSGASIVAVEWGRDKRADVVRTANELSAAGAQHVGVLFYGVPAKELSRVER